MRTAAAFLGYFGWATVLWIIWAVTGSALAVLVSLPFALMGLQSEALVLFMVVLVPICIYASYSDAWHEFKSRPRGLGIRMKRGWENGRIVFREEKY